MLLPLNAVQIAELRQTADKAKLEGEFDTGEMLHALLDSHEDKDETCESCDAAETAEDERDTLVDIIENAIERLEVLANVPLSELASEIESIVKDLRGAL